MRSFLAYLIIVLIVLFSGCTAEHEAAINAGHKILNAKVSDLPEKSIISRSGSRIQCERIEYCGVEMSPVLILSSDGSAVDGILYKADITPDNIDPVLDTFIEEYGKPTVSFPLITDWNLHMRWDFEDYGILFLSNDERLSILFSNNN